MDKADKSIRVEKAEKSILDKAEKSILDKAEKSIRAGKADKTEK